MASRERSGQTCGEERGQERFGASVAADRAACPLALRLVHPRAVGTVVSRAVSHATQLHRAATCFFVCKMFRGANADGLGFPAGMRADDNVPARTACLHQWMCVCLVSLSQSRISFRLNLLTLAPLLVCQLPPLQSAEPLSDRDLLELHELLDRDTKYMTFAWRRTSFKPCVMLISLATALCHPASQTFEQQTSLPTPRHCIHKQVRVCVQKYCACERAYGEHPILTIE